MDRAKPSLAITSIGFTGHNVELSDDLIKASFDDQWGPVFKKNTSFTALSTREKSSSELILELTSATKATEQWITPMDIDQPESYNAASLLETPFIGGFTNVIGSSNIGLLRRRQFPDLPVGLEDIQQYRTVFPLRIVSNGWKLHLGYGEISFELSDEFSQREEELQELIAESFSRGIARNIIEIHRIFLNDSGSDISTLQGFRDALRVEMSEKSHLRLALALSNSGQRPVIVKPHLVGVAKVGKDKKAMLFRVEKIGESSKSEDSSFLDKFIADRLEDESGAKGFGIESYLVEAGKGPYVSIPAGESIPISAVSLDPLGRDAKNVLNLFDLGALELAIAGYTLDGKEIVSGWSYFGRQMSTEEKQTLKTAGLALFQ